MKKLQIGAVAVLIFGAAAFMIQLHRIKQVEAENAALKEEMAQIRQENQSLTDAGKSSASLSQDDLRDLMRLRAQATGMYEAERENGQLRAERDHLARQLSRISSGEIQPEQTPDQQFTRAKINYAKQLGLAFFMYADDNNGRVPTNLTDAVEYIGSNALQSARYYGIEDDQVEFVYRGSLRDVRTPGQMILLRDKEPSRLADGRWEKVYLFCDGHVEVQMNSDGNFSEWERAHTPSEALTPSSP